MTQKRRYGLPAGKSLPGELTYSERHMQRLMGAQYRAIIVGLRQDGYSLRQISALLFERYGVSLSYDTLSRYLRKWEAQSNESPA